MTIQFLRGTTAKTATYTGANGEITLDTDKKAVVVHDGVKAGGYAQATETGIQKDAYTSAVAGGTVDAITATFSPSIDTLVDNLTLCVSALGANTIAAVTFTPKSGTIAPAGVVKGCNQPLVNGDIPGAGYPCKFRYNATWAKWMLLNPATGMSSSMAVGNCRLIKSGANLLLAPYNGNGVTIGGLVRQIPSAGVILAATGLTPNTTYFIYAYFNAGAIILDASTTGHSTDATTGIEIKTGDASRTLVGMARCITGPAWQDTAAQRFVISWFNRRAISCNGVSAGGSTSSVSVVELSSTMRAEFLTWPDEAIRFSLNGYASNATSGAASAGNVGIDGVGTLLYQTIFGTSSTANAYSDISGSGSNTYSEGYHYATGAVAVTAGTATYQNMQLSGEVRG